MQLDTEIKKITANNTKGMAFVLMVHLFDGLFCDDILIYTIGKMGYILSKHQVIPAAKVIVLPRPVAPGGFI